MGSSDVVYDGKPFASLLDAFIELAPTLDIGPKRELMKSDERAAVFMAPLVMRLEEVYADALALKESDPTPFAKKLFEKHLREFLLHLNMAGAVLLALNKKDDFGGSGSASTVVRVSSRHDLVQLL